MNDLKNPLIDCPPGTCPLCGNSMFISDIEMIYLELDEEGYPTDHNVEYSKIQGICSGCSNIIKYRRYGLQYIPYNRYNDLEYKRIEIEYKKPILINNTDIINN